MLCRTTSIGLVVGLGLTMMGCAPDRQARLDPSFGLFFNRDGADLTLAYGRANSDDVGLVLQCRSGSRQIEVSDVARRDGADRLVLTSGEAVDTLPARVDVGAGSPTLWASAKVSDAALQGFRRTGQIDVATAGARYTVSANATEHRGVEQFFDACEKA